MTSAKILQIPCSASQIALRNIAGMRAVVLVELVVCFPCLPNGIMIASILSVVLLEIVLTLSVLYSRKQGMYLWLLENNNKKYKNGIEGKQTNGIYLINSRVCIVNKRR